MDILNFLRKESNTLDLSIEDYASILAKAEIKKVTTEVLTENRVYYYAVLTYNKARYYVCVLTKHYELNTSHWLKITQKDGTQIHFLKKDIPEPLYKLCSKIITFAKNSI